MWLEAASIVVGSLIGIPILPLWIAFYSLKEGPPGLLIRIRKSWVHCWRHHSRHNVLLLLRGEDLRKHSRLFFVHSNDLHLLLRCHLHQGSGNPIVRQTSAIHTNGSAILLRSDRTVLITSRALRRLSIMHVDPLSALLGSDTMEHSVV